jgi:molybdenum cofactor cytidylyltransferase
LLQSPCDEIIIVLGAHARQIQPFIFIHSRIRVVYNKDYFFGQASSVKAGWRQADKTSQGALFMPVDCPLVQASSINIIIDHFKASGPDILVPSYQNKKGHPPIFHERLKSEVLALPVDKGLNSLFAIHPPQTIEINDPGIVKSFNTPEELEKINSKQ